MIITTWSSSSKLIKIELKLGEYEGGEQDKGEKVYLCLGINGIKWGQKKKEQLIIYKIIREGNKKVYMAS